MFGDIVSLITVETQTKANGYKEETGRTEREVFADIASVTRSEFFMAKQAGVAMALSVNLRAADYDGETLLSHGSKLYRVERAYGKGSELVELNCSEVIGGGS